MAATSVSINPPVPSPINKTTEAALRYLLTKDPDAFQHLIAICHRATARLFIPNPHEELKFVIQQDPRAADDPAYYHASRQPYVENQGDAKEDFIINFLLDYLLPYHSASPAELLLSANAGAFKNLGNACQKALVNIIRDCPACGSRKVKECIKCSRKLSHKEQNAGIKDCPDCSQALKGKGYHLVCPYGCEPVTVRNILAEDHSEDGDGTPLEDYVVARQKLDLRKWLHDARVELEQLGLFEGANVFAIAFLEGKGKRDITPTWSRMYGVSYKVARSRRNKFLERIALHRDSKIVRQLYNAILAASDRPTTPTLAVAESPATRAARRARSEAAKLMSEFYKTVSPKARKDMEEAVQVSIERFKALEDMEKSDLRKATPRVVTAEDRSQKEEQDAALGDLASGESADDYQDS